MTEAPISLDPGRDPWDQQPRETDRQYGRFLRYRDLGRMRSLTAITKVLTDIGDKLTYNTIKYQSHRYRWTERAQAWDRHQDLADSSRILQARRDIIDRHLGAASALLFKALTAVKATRPEDLDPADVVRWIKLATDLQIRAVGEPHQTIALTGPAGGPVQIEDISSLTDDQRLARSKEILSEMARRVGLAVTTPTGDDEEE
jgi:hypothetical protein